MASITEQYQKIYEQALEAQKKYNNNIKNKKTTTSSKKNNASKNNSNSNTQNKVASNQSNKNDSSSNPYNVSVAQPDYTKFIGNNKTSLYQNSTNSKNNPYQLKVAQPDHTKFKSQIDTIVEKGKKALAEREKAFNDWYTEDKKDMLFNADGSYRDLRSELNEFESKIKTEKADSAYSVYKNKQYKKELEKAIEFSDYLQVRDKEKTLSNAQEKIDFYTMQDAYNDNFLEKSAKKIGKVGANILNMPFQAADIVNDFLDPNFDINNPHNLSNQISSSVDKAEEQMQYNTNDFEQFALNTLESAVDFGTHYMLGMVTGIPSIVSMAAQSGLSKYAQNRREGYDEKTSLGNAILSGSLTMLTEKIGLDNFTKIASSGLGKFSVSALVSQALSEGAEEGIEYMAEPLIDYATLGKYPDYNAGELFMSVGLGMSGGALIGSAGNMISAVKTRKGANQLKADMQLLTDYANKNVLTNDEAFVVDQTLRLAKKALDKFESTSVIGNAVQFESDKVPQRSVEEIKQNFYSFLQPQVDAERASYKEKMAVANVIKNAQQTLLDKGIKMDVLQYSNLDEDVKKQVDTLQGLARDLNQDVVFDSELNVDGVTIDGYYDNETGRIVINPNGNNPAMSTFVHELTHGTESSKNYKLLKELVKASDKDFDKNVQNTKELYKSVTDLTDDGASQEYVAIYLQEMLGNEEFVKRLVKYDTSLASRIYEGVKKVVFNTKTSHDIEYAFMKAFRDSGISEQALLQYSFKDAKGKDIVLDENNELENAKNVLEVDNSTPTTSIDIRYSKGLTHKDIKNRSESKAQETFTRSFMDKKWMNPKYVDEDYFDYLISAELEIKNNGDVSEETKSKLKNATWKSFIVEEENASSIEMINDQKDIRKFMKNGSLSIDSIGSINQITDFKEFRKKNFGNFTFTKNGGRDVDSVYQELVEQYPHYFDESITHPADQIEAIAEFLNTRHEETKALHLNQQGLTTKEFEDFFNYKFDNFVNTVKGIPTETKEEDPVLANFKSKYSDLNPILVDRAVDEVQKNGYVSETTKGALKDDLMKFFGDESIFKDDPKAKNRIQDFISETVEYFATKGQYESDIDFANSVASKVNKLLKGYAGITNEDIDNLYDEVAAIKEADSLLKEKRDLRMLNYTDLVDDMLFKGKDSKGYMSQIERVFDKVADGDVELRTKIRNTLELPRYQAQIQYVNSLKKYNSTIEQIVKTGIREGSKESKAVQWIMEKQREDGSKYTNADLYNEFNYKMKNGKMAYDNIENAAKLLRKDYDDMYQTIEGIRNSIYGDVELKNELDTKELHAKFEIARENLNKIQSAVQNNPTAQNQRVYAAALNEYKLLSRQLSTKLEDNASGDSTRRQDLKYRENYAHRTYEKESVFLQLIKERVGVKEVPTKLAGVSDYAQPKTGYASFFKKRVGGSYEADALKGYAEYIQEASRIIAYDPLIEYYRDFTSALQNTAKDDTMSQFTRYLINYTNSLAGKTNPIDRPIRELMGDTLFGAFKEINSRVKANAILGNIRTAVTQFANAPMAASMLVKNGGTKSLQDLTKGSFNYLTSLFNGKGDKSNLSPFIQARFFDTDTDAIGIGAKVDNMFNFLLIKGDEIVTKMTWNAFYEQALRKGLDSPIFYADDLTRRTVAGRGHGEVPLALQSQVMNFVIPFQVETANTWNNFVDMSKDPKSWGALLVALLGDFFFNELFENLTGSRPLFDPIDVIRDAIKNEENLGTTSGHLAGEILGAIPGGNLTPTVLGMDSYETKKYFGDNDPSRYGTGNIGLSAIKDIASSVVDGKPLDAASDVVANFVLPGGGKQAQRTIESLQVNGIIPQYVNGEWVFSPAYYKRNGDVGYETDPEAILDNSSNLGNFIKQVAFGKWAGNEAQEYLNGGSSSGISSKSQKIIDWFTSKDENVSEKDIMAMTEEIEEARDGFTSSNPKGELIEWMDSKNYSNAEKNMIFDTYYGDSKQVTNLNNFSNYYNLSDRLNYEVKKIVLTAIGKKSSNKIDTIKNSKALEVRKKLDEIGLYDKYIDYILENDLDLSSMGLNKKVAKMTNEEFENEYGSIFENLNQSKTEKESKNLEYEKAINSSKAKKSKTSKSSTISQANKLKNINNIIDKISRSVSTNNDSKVDAILNKMKNNYPTNHTSNSELMKRYLKEHAYDAALFN